MGIVTFKEVAIGDTSETDRHTLRGVQRNHLDTHDVPQPCHHTVGAVGKLIFKGLVTSVLYRIVVSTHLMSLNHCTRKSMEANQ